MAVKLVALDIDGTLIPPQHYGDGDLYPSPQLADAIASLRERGIVVVLASGRMFPGTARIARHLGIDQPVICQQGCSVHLLDGTMLHEFPIPMPEALDIVGLANTLGHPYEWFNPLRYVVSRDCASAREYGRVSGIEPECADFPERSGFRPTGVGIISSAAEANAIHRELAARHAETLHLLDFPEVTVAVAAEANKGHALSLICADLGIDRSSVIAVGDSVNDASMLVWAGRGFAMAHSDRYALDAADELLEDGAEALADLLKSV
jgi:hydroxymethylpyrimidine pyrophosphatase-like HAD family hydrolase